MIILKLLIMIYNLYLEVIHIDEHDIKIQVILMKKILK